MQPAPASLRTRSIRSPRPQREPILSVFKPSLLARCSEGTVQLVNVQERGRARLKDDNNNFYFFSATLHPLVSFADFSAMTHLRYCGGVARGSARSQQSESRQIMGRGKEKKNRTPWLITRETLPVTRRPADFMPGRQKCDKTPKLVLRISRVRWLSHDLTAGGREPGFEI